MPIRAGRFTVRLAVSGEDVENALRLRHRVFVEELGATPAPGEEGIERDRFDEHCQHLILVDEDGTPRERVVGAYRMLPGKAALEGPGFYSAGEFDIGALEARAGECLEVGRTCVDREFRGGVATVLLWAGLAEYTFDNDVGILFGCASFHGTDPDAVAMPLSHLHHFHRAPSDLLTHALQPGRVEMDRLPKDEVDRKEALRGTPPLIKGYLRMGGVCGDGAYVDEAFGVIDVLLIVDVARADEATKESFRRQVASAIQRVAGDQ